MSQLQQVLVRLFLDHVAVHEGRQLALLDALHREDGVHDAVVEDFDGVRQPVAEHRCHVGQELAEGAGVCVGVCVCVCV